MKITEVEPILLTVDMPEEHPLRWSGGEAASVNCALVRVHTDGGITGLGDCYGSGFVAGEATAELFRLFGQFLRAKTHEMWPDVTRWMYRRILYWGRSGLAVAAASAVENALWDMREKRPVYRYIACWEGCATRNCRFMPAAVWNSSGGSESRDESAS